MTFQKIGSPGGSSSSSSADNQATTSHAIASPTAKSTSSAGAGENARDDKKQSWEQMEADSDRIRRAGQNLSIPSPPPPPQLAPLTRNSPKTSYGVGRSNSPLPKRKEIETDQKGKKRQLDHDSSLSRFERPTKEVKLRNEASVAPKNFNTTPGVVSKSNEYVATSAAMTQATRREHEERKGKDKVMSDKKINAIATQPSSEVHPSYITVHRHYSIDEFDSPDSTKPKRTTVVSSPKLSASLTNISSNRGTDHVTYRQTGGAGDTYIGGGPTRSLVVLGPDAGPDREGNRPRNAKTGFEFKPKGSESAQETSDREFYKRVKRDSDD